MSKVNPNPFINSGRKKSWVKRIGDKEAYLFILPCVIFFCFYIIYPLYDIFFHSFFKWDGLSPLKKFISFDNYINIFLYDDVFHIALRNSLYWAILTTSIQASLGLFLALLLDFSIRGKNLYKSIFFMPVPISVIVMGYVWGWLMYDVNLGQVNNFFRAIGLKGLALIWLGDPDIAIFSIILVNIWKWTGFSMVMYMAGMQSIPIELYEAATIDGASHWQRVRYITIPLLMPTHFTLIVLGTIGAFKTFDIVYVMTKGGPIHSSELIPTKIYYEAFNLFHQGYASAIAVILFLLALVTTIIQISYYSKGRKKGRL